jgi:hypothetical protein
MRKEIVLTKFEIILSVFLKGPRTSTINVSHDIGNPIFEL